MYTLILTIILTGGWDSSSKHGWAGTAIDSGTQYSSYEQCLAARSTWLQDHNEIYIRGHTKVNLSAVCVKAGD